MLPSLYITESQKPSNIKTDFDKWLKRRSFWAKCQNPTSKNCQKMLPMTLEIVHKTTSISTVIDFDKLRSVEEQTNESIYQ